MDILFLGVFFALGAVFASFVGVIVARLYTGTSIVSGRSRCDACGEVLAPLDLIPIFSFGRSGGRARCCGARLDPTSTLVELVLGVLFVAAYVHLGLTPALPFFLLALTTLLALVSYDLRHTILPSPILFVFLLASAGVWLTSTSGFERVTVLLTALGCGLFLALIHLLSRGRAMGFADAPLSFGLALLAGPLALSGLVFSFWVGAVIGIIMLAHLPKGSRMGVEVPFAPFLAAGFLLAYFTQWNPFIMVVELLSHALGAP